MKSLRNVVRFLYVMFLIFLIVVMTSSHDNFVVDVAVSLTVYKKKKKKESKQNPEDTVCE